MVRNPNHVGHNFVNTAVPQGELKSKQRARTMTPSLFTSSENNEKSEGDESNEHKLVIKKPKRKKSVHFPPDHAIAVDGSSGEDKYSNHSLIFEKNYHI